MSPEIILIGTPETQATRDAEHLLDGIIIALQEFDTERLLAIVEERDRINPEGWMQPLIRGYIEVWR